mmetsp:Transcript_11678/g.30212  ORF Transcript_11678/g.30212 Transcript_11678/m.30212 type:complete len:425 (+) Transcript_11678:221-1495(+)
MLRMVVLGRGAFRELEGRARRQRVVGQAALVSHAATQAAAPRPLRAHGNAVGARGLDHGRRRGSCRRRRLVEGHQVRQGDLLRPEDVRVGRRRVGGRAHGRRPERARELLLLAHQAPHQPHHLHAVHGGDGRELRLETAGGRHFARVPRAHSHGSHSRVNLLLLWCRRLLQGRVVAEAAGDLLLLLRLLQGRGLQVGGARGVGGTPELALVVREEAHEPLAAVQVRAHLGAVAARGEPALKDAVRVLARVAPLAGALPVVRARHRRVPRGPRVPSPGLLARVRERALCPVVRARSWASAHFELVHPEVRGRELGGVHIENRLLGPLLILLMTLLRLVLLLVRRERVHGGARAKDSGPGKGSPDRPVRLSLPLGSMGPKGLEGPRQSPGKSSVLRLRSLARSLAQNVTRPKEKPALNQPTQRARD